MTHQVASLKTPSNSERIQQEIKDYVVKNGLKAGDPLPSEGEFARRFEVSRNAVREGVKALESTGLLVVQRGNGIFVRDFSFAPLLANLPYGLIAHRRPLAELLEIREILELSLIERVVRDHDDEDLVAAKTALESMHRNAEAGERLDHDDRAFHRALFSVVSNTMVVDLLDVFWQAFDSAVEHLHLGSHAPIDTYRAHAAILDAVRERNVERARDLLKQHYAQVEELLATPEND